MDGVYNFCDYVSVDMEPVESVLEDTVGITTFTSLGTIPSASGKYRQCGCECVSELGFDVLYCLHVPWLIDLHFWKLPSDVWK